MKEPAHLIFRKLATISLVIFAVSAVSPAAHARPKGVMIGFNHDERDHRFLHDHRQFGVPYWWYADYGYRYGLQPNAFRLLAIRVTSRLTHSGK